MRLSTILKVVGMLVVAVIVGGDVVIMSTDYNQYEGLIAEKVKEATGRNLSIAGDIELELSFTPSLSVSGVRFENAEWGSKPDMLSVEKFLAQVALLPLLSNTIEVDYVLLQGAEILIEREADGRANFVFDAAAKESAIKKDETPASSSATGLSGDGSLPIPIVRKVLIENAKLTYRDVKAGVTETIVLKKILLDGEGPQSPVNLTFDMTLNGQPVFGGGQPGPLDGLTDPDKDWPLKLMVEASGARVGLDGPIRDPAGVKGFNVGVNVSGESLANLSALAGAPVPPISPYQVSAKIHGDPLQALQLVNIGVKVGKSDINGDVKVNLSGKKPSVDGKFTSELIDLADFMKPSSAAPEKSTDGSTSTSADKTPADSDGRVLPNDPLPLDALKPANAKIGLTAKRVLAQGIAIENIVTSVTPKDGDLQVAPMKAEISNGTLDGKVRLNAAAKTPALNDGIKASKIDLGKLLTDAAITDLLEGGLNAQVQLKGRGSSVRALAAGLDGQIRAVIGEGRLKTTALDTLSADHPV
ncbi:MAG: AsmA family protein [Pseudomonadota bacterium]|nr:AsmA family protein [Pseudomonadota bacterium]